MADPTYIACPRCGEPMAMSPMQKRLYHGRTISCQRCAKPFTITEQTPEPVPAPAVRPWAVPGAGASPPPPLPAQGAPAAAGAPPLGAGLAPGVRPGRGMTAGRMALLIVAVLAVVSFGLYFALAPTVHRAREAGRRSSCAMNLQQLGMALQMYANSTGGSFPDSLDALVLNGTVSPSMLVCPSSTDTPAPGGTFAEQTANLAKGGHQSYVYLGKGLTLASGRLPIAYEPLHHHGGQGANVLYTDGTVQFLPAAMAQTAVPQLGATTGPGAPVQAAPPMPQTAPVTPGG